MLLARRFSVLKTIETPPALHICQTRRLFSTTPKSYDSQSNNVSSFQFWTPAESKRIHLAPKRELPPQIISDQLKTTLNAPIPDGKQRTAPKFSDIGETFDFGALEDFVVENERSIKSSTSSAAERQQQFEQEAVEIAAAEYRALSEEMSRAGLASNLGYGKGLLARWFTTLTAAISEEQKKLGGDEKASPDVFALNADQLAVISMHSVLNDTLSEPEIPVYKIYHTMIEHCRAELTVQNLKKNEPSIYKNLKSHQALRVQDINRLYCDGKETPLDIKIKKFYSETLLECILKSATDTSEPPLPAFEKFQTKTTEGRYIYAVNLAPSVRSAIQTSETMAGLLHARHFPMVVKPKPWTNPRRGGYLTIKSDLVRNRGYFKQMTELSLIDTRDPSALQMIYESLNALSETPWRINNRLRDIIQNAIDRGGDMGKLPTMQDPPLPPKPEKATPVQLHFWQKECKKRIKQGYELVGARADVNYKLAVASKFADEVIYFPHNLDFRGRAYPIPPHLNHLGNDLCRSLLLFAEGRELGEEGLKWMKIHMSNLWGMDKVPFEDRVKFVDENMENIRESVKDPLDGSRWWLKADKPWQFLASGIELVDALDSGEPLKYISHLPIHQDGTCNGLQHYAALGGDVLGAKHVNLLPSDRPQDVYSGVMELVKQKVEEDFANDHPMAVVVRGHITRKVVKQTVMTSVYGVTFTGACRQIHGQLSDNKEIPEQHQYPAAAYLTKHVFASLGEIFLGAQTLMDWLALCARSIAKAGGDVTWTTPMGLHVVQPYKRITSKDLVTTATHSFSVKKQEELKVNVSKQKSAFPPNYIHSLDSTHMLLTALEMKSKNLTFASVHDSYWTHASDVPKMNQILREKFIQLHTSPLLDNLLADFQKAHPDVTFPPIPTKGQLDLNEVLKSPYFFH